ncbi:MAG: Mur ligase family protein, partial [Elusimicrobiota bacterium]
MGRASAASAPERASMSTAASAGKTRPRSGDRGTLAATLRFLDSRGETRWDLGLSRIRGLLGRMGDPQDAVPSIHVAGTNGKGTVCAFLASILKESGLRTGLYTSPHLLDVRERVAVDGKPVPARAFAAAVDAARRAERDPATYFELLTAAAFHHFREAGAEIAVVETGLGGRLDATNALASPLLTVITSIGLDHTDHLGKTLSAIADEKAGILKRGVPCLCGEGAPEPLSRIRRRAGEAGAPLTQARVRLETVATDWNLGRQRVILGGGAQGRAVPGARPFSSRAGGGVRELGLPLPGPAALRDPGTPPLRDSR